MLGSSRNPILRRKNQTYKVAIFDLCNEIWVDPVSAPSTTNGIVPVVDDETGARLQLEVGFGRLQAVPA